MISPKNLLTVSAILLSFATFAHAGDTAGGTVTLKSFKSAIKHGYLVRGPDEMDPDKTVLRLYLSSADIGARIKDCKTLSCADSALTDGAMVDFSDARHLGYAVRLNGERAQYSGGTDGAAFQLTKNQPDHLAGKLHIDDTKTDGAKVDATFDLTLVKAFTELH